jgi:hypothetical protein
MGIESQFKAAEEGLRAALVAGGDTAPHRAELARLRADLAGQQNLRAQLAEADERAKHQAAEAAIHLDAECIAAQAQARLTALLAPFSIEDFRHD